MMERGRFVRVIIDEGIVFTESTGEGGHRAVGILGVSSLLVIMNPEIVLTAAAPVEGIQSSLLGIVLWNNKTV